MMMTDETDTFVDVSELARVHTRAAIEVIAEIMNRSDASASARLSAARTLLAWGWGRVPAQRREEPNRPAPARRATTAAVDSTSPRKRPVPAQTLKSATLPAVADVVEPPLAHARGVSAAQVRWPCSPGALARAGPRSTGPPGRRLAFFSLAIARNVPASRLRFAQPLRRWLSFSYERSELEKLALCER